MTESILFRIPDVIVSEILAIWLQPTTISDIDTAFCNHNQRQYMLDFFQSKVFAVSVYERAFVCSLLKWCLWKGIKQRYTWFRMDLPSFWRRNKLSELVDVLNGSPKLNDISAVSSSCLTECLLKYHNRLTFPPQITYLELRQQTNVTSSVLTIIAKQFHCLTGLLIDRLNDFSNEEKITELQIVSLITANPLLQYIKLPSPNGRSHFFTMDTLLAALTCKDLEKFILDSGGCDDLPLCDVSYFLQHSRPKLQLLWLSNEDGELMYGRDGANLDLAHSFADAAGYAEFFDALPGHFTGLTCGRRGKETVPSLSHDSLFAAFSNNPGLLSVRLVLIENATAFDVLTALLEYCPSLHTVKLQMISGLHTTSGNNSQPTSSRSYATVFSECPNLRALHVKDSHVLHTSDVLSILVANPLLTMRCINCGNVFNGAVYHKVKAARFSTLENGRM